MSQKKEIFINVCIGLVIDSFALIFNLLVVVLFIRYRKPLLKNINNMLLFSMALADLFVGAFGIVNQTLKYSYLVSREVKSMDTWKLFGVLPFFGSAFMSIFSIAIMTADRVISVHYALRYDSIMTRFRAKVLIAFTWVTTATIIFIQGIIYLSISSEAELIIRYYLLSIFVFMGGMFLVISNTKLYLVINKKVKGTSEANSTNIRAQQDSTINDKILMTNSKEMKTEYDSRQKGQKPGNECHCFDLTGKSTTLHSVEIPTHHKLIRTPCRKETIIVTTTAATTREMKTEPTLRQSHKKRATEITVAMTESSVKAKTRASSDKYRNEDTTTALEMPFPIKKKARHKLLPISTEPTTNSVKSAFHQKSKQDRLYSVNIHRESINKNKLCIWMTALFIISWAPLTVYYLIINTTEFEGTYNLSTFFIGLASANSIFNPIVYFAKRKNLRNYFHTFFCRKNHTKPFEIEP